MHIRITKKRKKILELLKKSKGILSANDIHKKIPEIDLVTVYRNLDLFVKEGLITKVQLDTGESKYEYQKEPHHHALCTECKKIIHFSVPNKKIEDLLGLKDFEIRDISLLVKGRCRDVK